MRSLLWRRQRSFIAATRSAARAGQAFGWLLVAIGLAGLFGGGSGFGGLWLAVIGWFLINAARAEAAQALVRQALGDLRVRDVMHPAPAGSGAPTATPGNGRASAAPAVTPAATSPGGPVTTSPSGVATTPGATIEADRPVHDAVGVLGEADGGVAVLEDGRQVGLLRADDVNQALQRGLAEPREERDVRSAGALVWVVVGLVIVVAGAALYRPPYVVIAPGQAIEVSDEIRIEGVPVDDLSGRYLIATVSLNRRSALGILSAALREDRDVVSLRDVYPPGVSPEEYGRVQRQVFRESRQVAPAAAARAAGLPVSVTGRGARVVEVVDGSPAEGVLRPDDVVVEVEGEEVRTAPSLVDAVRSRPAGTDLSLVVERVNARRVVKVTSEELADVAGRVGIGVLVETRGLDVDLPFEIRFDERNIGGPSAGLAYGLAIADLLDDEDFAAGRILAATGTISLDGEIGPVGGLEQKAIAVDDAGAQLFLVPPSEIEQATGQGVTVRGVERLEEALAFLRLGA